MTKTPDMQLGIFADVALPLAIVDAMGPALAGAVDTWMYDLVSHHRMSVAKHTKLGSRISRGGHGGKYWFLSRSFRYANAVYDRGPMPISKMRAESFVASESGERFGEDRFRQVEYGGTFTSAEPMVVPIGKYRAGEYRKQLMQWLKEQSLQITKSGFLIRGKWRRSKTRSTNVATEVVGMLRKTRRERPVLGFHSQWESVFARKSADLDKVAQAAIVGDERAVSRFVTKWQRNSYIDMARSRARSQYAAANPNDKKNAGINRAGRAAAREAAMIYRQMVNPVTLETAR